MYFSIKADVRRLATAFASEHGYQLRKMRIKFMARSSYIYSDLYERSVQTFIVLPPAKGFAREHILEPLGTICGIPDVTACGMTDTFKASSKLTDLRASLL